MVLFIGIIIVVWLSVLTAWWLLTSVLRSSDFTKVKDRLAGASKAKKAKTLSVQPKQLLQTDLSSAPSLMANLFRRYDLLPRLNELIEQAGLKWGPLRTVHMCLGLFIIAAGFCWFILPVQFRPASLIAGTMAGSLPILYLFRTRKSRLRRWEELFPESLEFVSRSMRAGHAFSVSLEMIHREFQEPISGEFRRAFEEHNLGLPLDVALQKMAKRIPSLDVHFFVSAVLLQKRTGGNLAEILDKLAYVIRERFKLRGRIRAVSAHGKMTGTALTLIPVGVAVMMFWVNPDYIRFFFTDEVGNYMLGGAIMLQMIGYAIIRQIVNIEV
jgi:tight adherence protein B